MDLTGVFQNHSVSIDDLYRFNRTIQFPLTGFIKKVNLMKNAIVLKLIDINNLIDNFKLFMNFNNEENLQEIQNQIKEGQIIWIKNNIKSVISKNLDLRYALNYDKTTEIKIMDCNETQELI